MDKLLRRIRPAVRARAPYLVGFPEATTVKLNQNESPYDLPPEIKEEALRAFGRRWRRHSPPGPDAIPTGSWSATDPTISPGCWASR